MLLYFALVYLTRGKHLNIQCYICQMFSCHFSKQVGSLVNAIENLDDIHSELRQPSRAEQSGRLANQISPKTVSEG